MPKFCAAYGCANRSDKVDCKSKNINFHKFPLKDSNRLKEWILKIMRENFQPNEHSVLCSKHFNSEDFENISPFCKRRILKPGTVPSKFSFFNRQYRRGKQKIISYHLRNEFEQP